MPSRTAGRYARSSTTRPAITTGASAPRSTCGLPTRRGGPGRPRSSWLAVGQEADARVAADVSAIVGAECVVAGDPQTRAGDQHVISAEATASGGVEHHGASGRREPDHARRGHRPWPGLVTGVRVVCPPLMPAEVGIVCVGGGGVERIAAGVVDPLVADRGLGSGEGGCRVAQSRVRTMRALEAGGRYIDGAVIR